jgi:hypothetical protein
MKKFAWFETMALLVISVVAIAVGVFGRVG